MHETYKNVALVLEVEKAAMFLRGGLAELQKISPTNNYYDPLLLFLSSGFERLFKSMICLNYKEIHGKFPTYAEMKGGAESGHDIRYFKKMIEKMSVPVDRPFASEDYSVIMEDGTINDVMEVLTKYAMRGRYFHLDAILGNEQEFDPDSKWEKIETNLNIEQYGQNEWLKILQSKDGLELLYENSNNQLLCRIEMFLRAISRQFTFGDFSSEAVVYSTPLSVFEYIKDEELGKTNYNEYQPYERIR